MAKQDKIYDYERSYSYCLWLLSRQSYTAKQLGDKLRKKKAAPEVVAEVLAKLRDFDYLNDARYAETHVRTQKRHKGAYALKQALFYKGVAEETIDDALRDLGDDEQLEAALEQLAKNRWRWQGDPKAQRRKAYAFLARRGFGPDIVRAVLDRSDFGKVDD